MSRSIHQTSKQVARTNAKAQLTGDHSDIIALAQKQRYKRQQRERRKATSNQPPSATPEPPS